MPQIIPTRVVVEAKRVLAAGPDRTVSAAARRLAAGGTIDPVVLGRVAANFPGPITRRWVNSLDSQPQVEGKAALDYSDGIMIALMIPESLAGVIAVPDGQPAAELHITLAYLGSVEDVNDDSDFLLKLLGAVQDIASRQGNLSGQLSGTGRFISDGTGSALDAYYASVDLPGLEDFRYQLMQAITETGLEPSQEHGFTPHVTLAYLTRDQDAPEGRFIPRAVEFAEVHVVYGQNDIPVPFGGDNGESPDERLGQGNPFPTTTSATVNADGKSYDPTVRSHRRAQARKARTAP